MSKLEELIAELCPHGVNYDYLLNVADVLYGFPCDATKFNSEKTGTPLIRIRDVLNGITDTYTVEEVPCEYIIHKGDLLIGMDGNFHTGVWKGEDAFLCQRVCKIFSKNEAVILNGFLIHLLKPMMKRIEESKNSGTVKHLLAKDLKGVKVPVPPLEVQREIVRVLDDFTFLSAELSAELSARRKQYIYYRDSLLNFSNDNIPIRKIGEVTRVFSAARVHKNEWTMEGVPFFRSSDVIAAFNGENNSRGKAFISYELYEKLSAKSGKIEKDDLLITGGGSIGIPYIVPTDDPLYVKDADLLCIKKNDVLLSRFLYHFFLSTSFRDYLRNITHDATIAHYTITQIENTPVPVPDIETQKRLVNVLDNFEKICNDLNIGLPAEIDARQKQYEYYRDKILDFDEYREEVAK